MIRPNLSIFAPGAPALTALMAVLLASSATTACGTAVPESPSAQYTPAQQRMISKFGRIGYELRVDAVKGEEFMGVNFYQVGLPLPFYGTGKQTLRNRSRMDMNGPIPEQVRVVWRDSDEQGVESVAGSPYKGKVIGEDIIDVGSRIPQELIDDLRRDPKGQLRLKFRMSRKGVLLGWDIERRPGFEPGGRDSPGTVRHADAVHSFVGGDFREADIFNGKVVRPGWYIDRKTGRKIETDY